MIYLDNAATTFPKPESVYAAMDCVNRKYAVNIGRGAYAAARRAAKLSDETKTALRTLVHADIGTPVVFSPSITIALNQIILGYDWQAGSAVYVSPYEHNAVARPLHRLEKQGLIEIQLLPVQDDTLEIDLEKTKYLFSRKKPAAVFCTHISNVTGYILPVSELFEIAKKHGALTVLDTAQSLGLLEVDLRKLQADLIAFAGHKSLYGPIGIGGFINSSQIPLKHVIAGGTGSDSLNLEMPADPEGGYEAASANIAAIAGLHAALSVLDREGLFSLEKDLTVFARNRLMRLPNIHLYLPPEEAHIGVISFSVKGMRSEDAGMILDEDFDIAVRTGYHCAPFIHEYLKDKTSGGTVRIGLGQFNTEADIEAVCEAVEGL